MKKNSITLLLVPVLLISYNATAQNWLLGGNTLTKDTSIGSNNGFNVLFESNGFERGRLTTAGLWGFGTTAPNSKVHINSAAGQNGLRVQINGSTKFLVASNGGVAVGALATPPTNGLFVSANAGIGTTAPERKLHVFNGSAGTVTSNANAPLVVENSTHSYINVLAPTASERGILFGDPGNAQDGGIIYVGSTNALHFRTNGNVTRMTLSNTGNLDIAGGTLSFGSVETLADAGANTISSNSTFVPSSDNIRDLGSPTLRWNEVWATDGTINTSDERDKTNIKDLDYGIKEIMKLRSIRFNWKNGEAGGEKLGLIAQELKKVLPEVVRDYEYKLNEETGVSEKVPAARMGVLYADIIPVLIRSIQEQQTIIEEKDNQVNELQSQVTQLQSQFQQLQNALLKKGLISGMDMNNASLSKGYLYENAPNPFNQKTTIRYYLPENAVNATVQIVAANGAIVRTVRLTQKGNGQLELNGNELAAGVYTYSLIMDGKRMDSKKMILTR